MEATALLVLTLLCCHIVQATALLTVSPGRSKFFKWDSVSLSCTEPEPWVVVRNTSTDTRGRCEEDWGRVKGSMCTLGALLPEDSGLYWCERDKRSSDPVKIDVYEHREIRTSTSLTPTHFSETTPPTTETTPVSQRPLAVALLCHLLVLCPYVLSTVIMVSLCRQTRSEDAPPPVTRDYDVTAIATEYNF